MVESLEKSSSMTYREAMEFIYEYGIILPGDFFDRKILEAQKVINNYRIQEFLKYEKKI